MTDLQALREDRGGNQAATIFGESRWRLLIEEALRRAYLFERVARHRLPQVLREGLLAVALQPIRALGSPGRAPVGFEAFSRFPVEPLIPPCVWYSAARSIGVETQLELLAVRRALDLLPRLPQHCFLAINLSPRTCAHPAFRVLLSSTPADRVVIEVSARDLVGPDAGGIHMAKAVGAKIAADDVAISTREELQEVMHFSPTYVKIDATDGIAANSELTDVVRRLVALGLEVIASRIEEEEDLPFLPKLGVRLGQGHLLGFPHLVVGGFLKHSALLAPTPALSSD